MTHPIFYRPNRLLLAIAALVLTIIGASIGAVLTPAYADSLVDNVNGMTLDEDGKEIRFTGMVIDEQGRVKQLLQRKDKRPEKLDYGYDAKGAYLLPGMIDAHGHVMALGYTALTLDLSDTKTLADALSKISAWASANPDRPWIIGRGWNQEKWGLGRFPTAAELDMAVPDRPIWLERVDGHAGWANSRAMQIANITGNSKSPMGGQIISVDGAPSGVFIDGAMALIRDFVPPPRPIDRDLALIEAQKILLANGVTAIADMGTSLEDWQAFRRAGDEGRLQIRIMAYADTIDNMSLIAGSRPTPWLYEDKLRLGGIKIYLDGALGSRGARLKKPYADASDNYGLYLVDDTELLNMISRASMDGFQVAIHAIGDAANNEALSAIEILARDYPGDRRWRIEHAQIVDPTDIARFGQHGIIASMQPVHQISDRKMAEARLGPERLLGAYAWKSIAASGARLAFGSDAPVEAAKPFIGIAVAITREDENGEPFGGWQAQERLGRIAVLAAYSKDAAYAGFAEQRFGMLLPGMRADFILVDQDIILASPGQIRNIQILESWVGGERFYQRSSRQTE